jgi:hypothetical protein
MYSLNTILFRTMRPLWSNLQGMSHTLGKIHIQVYRGTEVCLGYFMEKVHLRNLGAKRL